MIQAGEGVSVGRRASLGNDRRALFDSVGFGVEGRRYARRYGLTSRFAPFVDFVAQRA